MNKIKCLEPLLSTFEAVFATRPQPTATLMLLSAPEQRWLSPPVSSKEPSDSQNWPFEPAATGGLTMTMTTETGKTHPSIETQPAGDEPQFSERQADQMPIRIAIVEDDFAVRENLALLIGESPQFDCVATCSNTEAALEQLPAVKPDVVLMDIHLPGENGIVCVQRLRARLPETQVIMLTIEENLERVFESLKAGATGYLVKHASTQEILDAVAEVHRGGAPMSSQIARKVVTAFREPLPGGSEDLQLSQREKQVLKLLASGHRSKEIALELKIGLTTVNTYIRKIYQKLHVRSRAQAVARYRAQ